MGAFGGLRSNHLSKGLVLHTENGVMTRAGGMMSAINQIHGRSSDFVG